MREREKERESEREVLLHTFVRLPGSTTTSIAQPAWSMSSTIDKVESSWIIFQHICICDRLEAQLTYADALVVVVFPMLDNKLIWQFNADRFWIVHVLMCKRPKGKEAERQKFSQFLHSLQSCPKDERKYKWNVCLFTNFSTGKDQTRQEINPTVRHSRTVFNSDITLAKLF